jgi:hypothetical protein
VFLEFALAGALPAKSLAGYQAELRQGRSPAEAYQGFRELVLRRAVGGLPPWTELPGCARRFARAAGLDPDTEEERLLAELLVLPATRRAPAGFWRHGRPALLRMGAASAALRGRLLNLFPARPARAAGTLLRLLRSGGLACSMRLARSTGSPSPPRRFLPKPCRRWAPPVGSATTSQPRGRAGGRRRTRWSPRCCA